MLFEDMLHTRIVGLNHPLEAMLTNSNPILHPARLYTLFKDFNPKHPFVAPPLFYEDWTDESSEILIACDNEFQSLVKSIGIKESVIPSLLEYYESTDACSLTKKYVRLWRSKAYMHRLNLYPGECMFRTMTIGIFKRISPWV